MERKSHKAAAEHHVHVHVHHHHGAMAKGAKAEPKGHKPTAKATRKPHEKK